MSVDLSDNYVFITIKMLVIAGSEYGLCWSKQDYKNSRVKWPSVSRQCKFMALILTPAFVNTCTEIAWHHQCGVIAGWRPVISAQLSTFLELRPPEFICMDTKLYQQGADSSFVHYAENNLWYPLKMHPIKTQKSMKLYYALKRLFSLDDSFSYLVFQFIHFQ